MQDDTASPKLLSACLEEIFIKFDRTNKKIATGIEFLSNLQIPDYIVLFSQTTALNMAEELSWETLCTSGAKYE